jgi:hypothetical protein
MDTDTSRTGTGDRLQDAAGGLLDQAGRTAESQASWTMTKAGDTLDEVARAVRDAGSGLRQDRPEIAGFADTAAERVEEAARYLRVHDAADLIDEASRFARQQPVVVVGGFLLAGLALGRLLKSGSTASRYGYGMTGDYRGTGYRSGYGTDYDTSYRGSTAYSGTSRTATEYGREATMAASSAGTPRSTTTRPTTRTTGSTGGGTSGTTSTKSTSRSTRANTTSSER